MAPTRHCEFEEDDLELLSFVDESGTPWWLQVRQQIIESLNYLQNVDAIYDVRAKPRKQSSKSIQYICKALVHNRLSVMQNNSNQVMFHIDTTRYSKDDSGKLSNVFSDYLMSLRPDSSAVMEKAPVDWEWNIMRDRSCVYDFTPEFVMCRIFSKVHEKQIASSYLPFSDYVVKKAKNMFMKDSDEEWLINQIRSSILAAVADKRYSDWLMRHLGKNIKLMIMLGSIFSRSYYITRRLKEAGIRVAEIQHGVFPEKESALFHPAESITLNEDYLLGIPDDFLTFGDIWNNQLDMPVNKISIGSPSRDVRMNRFSSCGKNAILVLGCLHDTKGHIDLVKELARKMPAEKVMFRPHPSELNNVQKVLGNDEIELDSGELYCSLASAKAVICEYSTSMYEALGVSGKVIAWRTPYSRAKMPNSPFINVDNVDDIVSEIKDESSCLMQKDLADTVWSDGWQYRFDRYLQEMGI